MLKPVLLSVGLLVPFAAAAEDIKGFAERPATGKEVSYCDHDRDLSGQVVFLGAGDNTEAPLELLMCFPSKDGQVKVWQMDCEFAKAFKDIFDFSVNHPELGDVAKNGSEKLAVSLNYCNGLFLS